MIVVVRGDPMKIGTSLCGLDILSPRHPMLFSLIVSRMGMQSNTSDQVVVLNDLGEMDSSCQPDREGRQLTLIPKMYPTDVLNILTETGGFTIESQSNVAGDVVWSLSK